MNKQLVIFDLDGTLLDTVADLANATNQALVRCGYPPHPTEAYYRFVGNGINKLFARALPEEARTEENVQHIRALFIPYYNEHNADDSRPYPGIVELLTHLQNQGIRLAVASNKYQQATAKLVGHFFPDIRFAAVYGQREGIPIKPDPAIVNDILSVTGISRARALYVGDSGVDMQTARNASVESAGVIWGFRDEEELRVNGADHIIHNAKDILKLTL
ncbi:MAG: HAD family hydrolase [Bacteroidaceae bacterium]|nr:HAD family hydrolase [Bacteroidaceae bacterium]